DVVGRMPPNFGRGGFMRLLREGPERAAIVGLGIRRASPAGLAHRERGQWLANELVVRLRNALPRDGQRRQLHGRNAVVGVPDAEGEVLAAVRPTMGASVPLLAPVDLNANVERLMVRAADAFVLYHTTPHLDVFETGERVTSALRRMMIEQARPVTAFQKMPM